MRSVTSQETCVEIHPKNIFFKFNYTGLGSEARQSISTIAASSTIIMSPAQQSATSSTTGRLFEQAGAPWECQSFDAHQSNGGAGGKCVVSHQNRH